jgi:uncharacterized membrane protein YhaH (DUF805 family)
MSDTAAPNRTGGVAFQDAIKTGFSKYATFAGRAPRSEFWFWTLFAFLGSLVASIVDVVLGVDFEGTGGPVNGLFNLAILIPNLAVSVRRLHDVDRSGWWLLLIFIPIIGLIVLLWWDLTRGTSGDNRFGPDPLA